MACLAGVRTEASDERSVSAVYPNKMPRNNRERCGGTSLKQT